ncbi:MAG TPA: hypothetical protein VHM19_18105, partial [Polyangiales bacterium]|nr:hypothetical protein [Polyangiales bacterium]
VPGVGSNGAMLLDQIAMAGGTGMYIPPTDAMSLQQKIHDIVLQAVGIDSCHITVNPAAEAPDKVHLIVNANGMDAEVPQTFSSGEKAWTISADGATIDLLGNTCDAAKSGQYAMIHFEFGCVDVPPAMPPIPL